MAYAKAGAATAVQYPCEICPLRGRETFRPFSDSELDFMSGFKRGELAAAAGTLIFQESGNGAHMYTVLSGWGIRYKSLSNGGRQILNFLFPGDLIGLQASLQGEMDHSVEALTDMLLCVFERDRFLDLYDRYPSLAFDVTWLSALEHRLTDSNLVSVGRRTALERLAYLVLLLFRRARSVGLAEQGRVRFPFTQQHLADALGMSLVHTNKTLARLRDHGAVTWRKREFRVDDEERLARLANWEPPEEASRPLL